jgi:DNA processing protein
MALDADLEAWLRLSLTDGLGAQTLRKLLLEFATPEAVLAAPRRALAARVAPELAAAIAAGGAQEQRIAAVERWLEDPANRIVTLADGDYPQALLQIPDPPPLLYIKGRGELLNRPGFAVVGSRNATVQGIANAEAFAAALGEAGFAIVSGLALGIDAAAHRGGLASRSSTVAVVGTGLDSVYPKRNHALAHDIATRGLLVSEFALGTPPLAANFPRRNRLICGLARGVLVVEAALSSGSLITARLAADQGREVFAIPGSIHSPLAKGCHALIKQGAKLAESAQDILEELGMAGAARASASDAVAKQLHPLITHIGFEPVDAQALVERSGLDAAAVNAALTELEIAGAIEALPGGRWQRIR